MGEARQASISFGGAGAPAPPGGAAPEDARKAFEIIRSCERVLPLLLAADSLPPAEREALVRAARKLRLALGLALAGLEGGDGDAG